MTESKIPNAHTNGFPVFLAIVNLLAVVPVAINTLSITAGFWDGVFVLAGVFFTWKFISLLTKSHEFPETRISPKHRDYILKKGVYGEIRNPVAASMIYLNIALLLISRSLALITFVPIFGAFWYILARYQDNEMIKIFGEKYREHMANTGLIRGKVGAEERLTDSGYGMY